MYYIYISLILIVFEKIPKSVELNYEYGCRNNRKSVHSLHNFQVRSILWRKEYYVCRIRRIIHDFDIFMQVAFRSGNSQRYARTSGSICFRRLRFLTQLPFFQMSIHTCANCSASRGYQNSSHKNYYRFSASLFFVPLVAEAAPKSSWRYLNL